MAKLDFIRVKNFHASKNTSNKVKKWEKIFANTYLTVWITINYGKFLEMGVPDHLSCLLGNLYAGQEATVRTRHGTTD